MTAEPIPVLVAQVRRRRQRLWRYAPVCILGSILLSILAALKLAADPSGRHSLAFLAPVILAAVLAVAALTLCLWRLKRKSRRLQSQTFWITLGATLLVFIALPVLALIPPRRQSPNFQKSAIPPPAPLPSDTDTGG